MTYIFVIGLGNIASEGEQGVEHITGHIRTLFDQSCNFDAHKVHVVRLDHSIHESQDAKVVDDLKQKAFIST